MVITGRPHCYTEVLLVCKMRRCSMTYIDLKNVPLQSVCGRLRFHARGMVPLG